MTKSEFRFKLQVTAKASADSTCSTSSANAPTLPAELLHLIFDVSDDKSLVTYGLVSKTWLHMTRYRVFSHLELGARNITDDFITLLNSKFCTFLDVVTKLYINADIKKIEQLIPYVIGMDRITRLTVIPAGSFIQPLSRASQRGLQSFSNITYLDIRFDFEDFSDMINFVCSFPYVEEMVLASDWTSPYINTHYVRPPTSLRALTLHSYHKHIIDWLLQLDPIPTIPYLALHSVSLDPETLISVQRILQELKQNLHRLEVSFEAPFLHYFLIDSIDTLLNFSDNTELRVLTIAMAEIPQSLQRTIAKLLLASITSKQLLEITLDSVSIDEDPLYLQEWSEVDEILTIVSTKSSRIRILSESSSIWIAQAFPQCAKLGLLG